MRERIANYVIMADLVAKNRRESRWLVTMGSSSSEIELPSYSNMHKVGVPLGLQFKRFEGGRLLPYTGPYRVWGWDHRRVVLAFKEDRRVDH